MLENVGRCLPKIDKTVCTLENNKKGHPLKYQRYGSSNNFIKVTGRTSMKCIRCTDKIGEENEKRAPISYIDQLIVNPVSFPIFEKKVSDMTKVDLVLQCLLRQNKFVGLAVKIDMTGKRVQLYNNLISVENSVSQTIAPLLTGYNKTKDTYKVWKMQPAIYKRNKIFIKQKIAW